MSHRHAHPVGHLNTYRIEALTDGVFAIVMTLLVFDIKIPNVPIAALPSALVGLWPKFLGYVVSFVLLGIYWVGHRAQFNFIRRTDQNAQWITILFLSFSAFVPFSTGLLSRYPREVLAIAIYGINLILIGVALYWHWWYATTDYHLVDEDISPVVVRLGAQRCLLAPIGYIIAIGLAFINPYLSLITCAIVPFLYILPSLQRVWGHIVIHSLPETEGRHKGSEEMVD